MEAGSIHMTDLNHSVSASPEAKLIPCGPGPHCQSHYLQRLFVCSKASGKQRHSYQDFQGHLLQAGREPELSLQCAIFGHLDLLKVFFLLRGERDWMQGVRKRDNEA